MAAVLLLLLFILMCTFSLIKSHESPLALMSGSDAFESWNWVLKVLLSERAGLDCIVLYAACPHSEVSSDSMA